MNTKNLIEDLKKISDCLNLTVNELHSKDEKEAKDLFANLNYFGQLIDDLEKPTYTITENQVEELGCQKMVLEELLKNWDDMIKPEAHLKKSIQDLTEQFSETLDTILLAKN